MPTMVMNAGKALSMLFQSISPHVGHHEVADDHERAAGGGAGDHADDGGEERADDEQRADHDVGKARARAGCGARGGLDEARDGACAEEAADCGSRGVDHQDGLNVLDVAVFIDELALLADGHHGSHGVEEVAHEQREHEHQKHGLHEHLDDGNVARGGSVWKGAANALKSRPKFHSVGSGVTPSGMPTTVATMMEMTKPPFTLSTCKMTASTIETSATMQIGEDSSPSAMNVEGSSAISPPPSGR